MSIQTTPAAPQEHESRSLVFMIPSGLLNFQRISKVLKDIHTYQDEKFPR